jgi:hypothetical protein
MVLIAAIVGFGVSLLLLPEPSGGTGRTVVIKSLKGETLTLDLSRAQTVEVEGLLGTTTISIDHGAVSFIESPCPHKLCIKRGPVSRVGDLVACVPNGVIAMIEGESDYDVITQ